MSSLRIVSRRSELALVQARSIQSLLGGEIIEVTSSGDQDLSRPLYALPTMGVFVRALEVKLLDDTADLAVHSLKDMPTEQPQGLHLAAVPEITHPRGDVVIMSPANRHLTLDTLPAGARIGTSSLRRQATLAGLYGQNHFQYVAIRGNLNTRIRKLEEEQADCLILAAAGLHRLGWDSTLPLQYLDERRFLYAPGQAALGLECPTTSQYLDRIQALNHTESRYRIEAERAFMKELEGGCKVPLGVWTGVQGTQITLIGQVWGVDGGFTLRMEETGNLEDAVNVGKSLAERMKREGATAALLEVRRRNEELAASLAA